MAETLLRSMRVSPITPLPDPVPFIEPLRKAVRDSFLIDVTGPVDHEKRRVAVNAYKEAKGVEKTVTEQLKSASLDKHSQSKPDCDNAFAANPCGAEFVRSSVATGRNVGCIKEREVDRKSRGTLFTDLMNDIIEYRRADPKNDTFKAIHTKMEESVLLYETDFVSLARAAVYQMDATGSAFVAPEVPVCSVVGHVCGIADFILVDGEDNYSVLEVKTTEFSIKPALSTMAQGVMYSLCLMEMLKLNYIPQVYVQVINMSRGAVELHRLDVRSTVTRVQEVAPLLGLQAFYTGCTRKMTQREEESSEDEFHDAVDRIAAMSITPTKPPSSPPAHASALLAECMRIITQGIPNYSSDKAQLILRENAEVMRIPVCNEMLDSRLAVAVVNIASCVKARFRLVGLIGALERNRIDFTSVSRFTMSLGSVQLSALPGCEWVAASKETPDKPWTPKVVERFIHTVFRNRFPEVSSLNVHRE